MTTVKVWVGFAGALVLAGCGGDDGAAETDGGSTSAATTTGAPSVTTAMTATTGSQTTASGTSPATTDASDSTATGPADDTGTESETSGCDTKCPSGEGAIAVAVGYGTRRVRSADGITWDNFVEVDANGGDDNNLLRGVSYGNGLFMAVGGAGDGLSMVSSDGVEWRNEWREHPSFISDTVWLGDCFVGAGGNGYRPHTTDEGATWNEGGSFFGGHYRDIVVLGDIAVAVGHTYEGVGLSSTTADGVSWTDDLTGGTSFHNAASGGGVVVAVGSGGRVASSSDGLTWTDAALGLGGTRGVFWSEGVFYIATDGGYFTSTNGEDWTEESVQGPSISAELDGAFLASIWPAGVQRAAAFGEPWETVFQAKGSGLSDIAVGVPEAAL